LGGTLRRSVAHQFLQAWKIIDLGVEKRKSLRRPDVKIKYHSEFPACVKTPDPAHRRPGFDPNPTSPPAARSPAAGDRTRLKPTKGKRLW
jgi:hypothetical protein